MGARKTVRRHHHQSRRIRHHPRWLADLKPVQVKELKEAFEVMESEGKGKGTLRPERMTRAQAREMENVNDNEEPELAEREGTEGMLKSVAYMEQPEVYCELGKEDWV